MRKPAIVTLMLLVGCASYRAHDMPLRSPGSYSAHTKVGAISLGAQPIDDSAASEHALGENVTTEFTPVQIAIEVGTKGKFLVDRQAARLKCATGSTLRPSTSETMYRTYKHDVTGHAIGGGLVGASAATEANDEMRSDWQAKEFPAQLTLSTGGRHGGMIFFEGRCKKGPRTLVLVVEPKSTEEQITIAVDIP